MTGFVYFLRCGDFVKIGYSENPKRRLLHLQTATPYDFELIGAHKGSREQEQYLHKTFAHLRHRHEWFRCALMRMLLRKATLLDRWRARRHPIHWVNKCKNEIAAYEKEHGRSLGAFGLGIGVRDYEAPDE